MGVTWSDEVDEILDGDLVAGMAYLTPAKGVVIAPIAPLGLRDRERGTVTVTSSLAMWRKLDRIRQRSGVAMAYHTRKHGQTDRPGFVSVQGRASFDPQPDRAWLESIAPQHERDLGPRKTGLVGRMLHTYYWERVAIEIAVERIVHYPDTAATGEPTVLGAPAAAPPESQGEPTNGTGPRIEVGKVASQVGRLPHALLGWCGADELPEVVPVTAAEATYEGLLLTVPPGTVPPGGRRGGLTAHDFQGRMLGQDQRLYTGWIAAEGDRVLYSPHTKSGYRLPASDLAYTIACASIVARMPAARRAGIAS